MRREGNCAISTEISSTTVHRRTACSKLSRRSASRYRGTAAGSARARLQAVSSRNMYSEHGLEARISPPDGQVCQSLMVVWNWMPGSAQCQAAEPILSHSSRALTVLCTLPSVRRMRSSPHPPPRRAGSRRSRAPSCWSSGRPPSDRPRRPVGVVDGDIDVGEALAGILDHAADGGVHHAGLAGGLDLAFQCRVPSPGRSRNRPCPRSSRRP